MLLNTMLLKALIKHGLKTMLLKPGVAFYV